MEATNKYTWRLKDATYRDPHLHKKPQAINREHLKPRTADHPFFIEEAQRINREVTDSKGAFEIHHPRDLSAESEP